MGARSARSNTGTFSTSSGKAPEGVSSAACRSASFSSVTAGKISTGLFGLLLAYFFLDVAPAGGSPANVLANLRRIPNPLTAFVAPPRLAPLQPTGASQEARGVVTQVAEPRWSGMAALRSADA